MKANETHGPEQIRAWLNHCEQLMRRNLISADQRSAIRFAIQWAPYGGADASEIFPRFGVGRRRYVSLVEEALMPIDADDTHSRTVKYHLAAQLRQAWLPA